MFTVFMVQCTANGKAYIGFTGKTAQEEVDNIFNLARRGGYQRLTDEFVLDVDLYGEDQFEVTVIKECESSFEAKRVRAEQIKKYKSREFGEYNHRRPSSFTLNGINTKLTEDIMVLSKQGNKMSDMKIVGATYGISPIQLKIKQRRYERFVDAYDQVNAKGDWPMKRLCSLFNCEPKDILGISKYRGSTKSYKELAEEFDNNLTRSINDAAELDNGMEALGI